MEKKKQVILLSIILLAGFVLRIFFVDKSIIGDMLVNAEWGQKIVESGAREQYYRSDWYYTPPVYPPLSQLVFGAAYYLYDHKYVLSQMHNVVKIPPAFFILYFHKWGYFLLLKLPGILADLGLSVLIYGVVQKLTKDSKKAVMSAAFYALNPLTIFLSGVWGQTDSLVALLAIGSFLLLNSNKVLFSLPLLFLSLYFKPSWAIFIPYYIFLLIIRKPKIKSVLFSLVLTVALFLAITLPFAKENVLVFIWDLFANKIPLPLGAVGKATNSAFNFYSIFYKIDIDPPPGFIGYIGLILVNAFAFIRTKREKNHLQGLFVGLFTIGIGSFLFMTSMLERYFFPGFIPMVILMFSRPKLLWSLVIMNLIFFANIIWSFYRRTSDEIGRPFVVNNFLLTRILSFVQVFVFIRALKMIQFKRE